MSTDFRKFEIYLNMNQDELLNLKVAKDVILEAERKEKIPHYEKQTIINIIHQIEKQL